MKALNSQEVSQVAGADYIDAVAQDEYERMLKQQWLENSYI